MYDFFQLRLGDRGAKWATACWYALLLALVLLSIAAPAGEFRYGNL